jgi:hypothetical protein
VTSERKSERPFTEQLDLGTLTALARAIDAKSKWTAGHSERVTNLALKMGHAMGLPAKEFGDYPSWRVVARHREDRYATDHSGQARQTRTWGNADYAGPRTGVTGSRKKGVIAVAIAYRLGPLGFLALPELTRESRAARREPAA